MSTLENLIADTSTSLHNFADMVGESRQALASQLKSKNHLQFAYKYAVKLGLSRIYGVENGCSVEVIIKKI